jgi:uncharacterized membrane-anchored protein
MYAALVISAGIAAGDHIHELPGVPFVRGAYLLALAFAIVRVDPRWDRVVIVSVAWLALFGAIAIGGQLWQRYTDDGTGNYILIDPVSFSVSVASEVLLGVAALTLYAVRRGAG